MTSAPKPVVWGYLNNRRKVLTVRNTYAAIDIIIIIKLTSIFYGSLQSMVTLLYSNQLYKIVEDASRN